MFSVLKNLSLFKILYLLWVIIFKKLNFCLKLFIYLKRIFRCLSSSLVNSSLLSLSIGRSSSLLLSLSFCRFGNLLLSLAIGICCLLFSLNLDIRFCNLLLWRLGLSLNILRRLSERFKAFEVTVKPSSWEAAGLYS